MDMAAEKAIAELSWEGIEYLFRPTVMGELLLRRPLMPAPTELKQLEAMCDLLGAPNERIWPGFSSLPLARTVRLPVQPYNELPTRLARPEVRALFDRAMADANDGQARFEQVKKYALLPTTFTDSSGELTPTLKLKRRIINERYAAEIEALYAG